MVIRWTTLTEPLSSSVFQEKEERIGDVERTRMSLRRESWCSKRMDRVSSGSVVGWKTDPSLAVCEKVLFHRMNLSAFGLNRSSRVTGVTVK